MNPPPAEGPTLFCQSCSELAPQHAKVCPHCGEPTGFSPLTRLWAHPKVLFCLVCALSALLSSAAFLTGKALGAQEAARTQAFLESRGEEVDPETIEAAREAELRLHEELRQKIAFAKSTLARQQPALQEAARLEAELHSLPSEALIRRLRIARRKELDALFKRGGKR